MSARVGYNGGSTGAPTYRDVYSRKTGHVKFISVICDGAVTGVCQAAIHWFNVLGLSILLLSGLGIFNAHPALYWGLSSCPGRPAVLEITTKTQAHTPLGADNGAGSASAVPGELSGKKEAYCALPDMSLTPPAY